MLIDRSIMTIFLLAVPFLLAALAPSRASTPSDFPEGTATPSEICGACHRAIYWEYATGFGGDLKYPGIVCQSSKEKHSASQCFAPGEQRTPNRELPRIQFMPEKWKKKDGPVSFTT